MEPELRKKLAYIGHPDFLKHEAWTDHPESPQRLLVIRKVLEQEGLLQTFEEFLAPMASEEQLLMAHTKGYIDHLQAISPKEGHLHIDMDTAMNPFTVLAGKRAAGAAILAVDLVLSGKHNKAFCAIRPPGHHAECSKAMGFCFFNNIALAARHAMRTRKLKRIAILDFDAHHGNGTEQILHNDEGVLICSSFQSPFYPFSDFRLQCERIVNTELAPGTTSKTFQEKVSKTWFPKIEEFKPELFLISAGFDAVDGDPLADLKLVPEDFGWITKKLATLADKHAQGRMVSVLEGGYNISKLGACVVAHLQALKDLNK